MSKVLSFCVFLGFLLLCHQSNAQNIRFPRYETVSFAPASANVAVGSGLNFAGQMQNLTADVYTPQADTGSHRALAIVLFGGSFITGSRTDNYVVATCQAMAARGYVAAAIDYRIGMANQSQDQLLAAVYRATQDVNRAIRFFKANASTYRVDTNNIVLIGYSAGAIAALHSVFWDQSEVPSQVGLALGPINPVMVNNRHSTNVRGVYSAAGGLINPSWISNKNTEFHFWHNQQDPIVPYNTGPINGAGTLNPIINAANMWSEITSINTAGVHLPTFPSVAADALAADVLDKTRLFLVNPPVVVINNTNPNTTLNVWNARPLNAVYVRGRVHLVSIRPSGASRYSRNTTTNPNSFIRVDSSTLSGFHRPVIAFCRLQYEAGTGHPVVPARFINQEQLIIATDRDLVGSGNTVFGTRSLITAPFIRGLHYRLGTFNPLGGNTKTLTGVSRVGYLRITDNSRTLLVNGDLTTAGILMDVNGLNMQGNALRLEQVGNIPLIGFRKINTNISEVDQIDRPSVSGWNATRSSVTNLISNNVRPAGRGAWVQVGSPMLSTPLTQFSEAGDLRAAGGTGVNAPTIQLYNGLLANPWYNPSSILNIIEREGALIWFRDSFWSNNGGRLSISGTLREQFFNESFELPNQVAGAANHHLISNPFTHQIDFSQTPVGSPFSNFPLEISVWNHMSRNYRQWSQSFGSVNGGSPRVEALQSFLVRQPQLSGSILTIPYYNPSDVISGSTTFDTDLSNIVVGTRSLQRNYAEPVITLTATAPNGETDEAKVKLLSSASANYAASEDLVKFEGAFMNLTTLSTDGKELAGNALAGNVNDIIPIRFSASDAGTYRLNMQVSSTIAQPVYLLNTSTGEQTLLPAGNDFSVAITVGPNQVFRAISDYALSFSAVTNAKAAVSSAIAVFPNPAVDNITVEIPSSVQVTGVVSLVDMKGAVLKSFDAELFSNSSSISIKDIPAGVYMLSIPTAGERVLRKVVKQ